MLPLDARPLSELVLERPRAVPARRRYVYRPGTAMVPEAVAVNVRNRSHRIVADVVVADGDARRLEGVLLAQGSLLGGWSLFVSAGSLRYVHNLAAHQENRIEAPLSLGPGRHQLSFHFVRTGDHRGTGELRVDGATVAHGEIPAFTPLRFSLTGAGLTCGYSGELPVCDDYRAPFRFTAGLEQVAVEVEGEPFEDAEGESRIAIETQ